MKIRWWCFVSYELELTDLVERCPEVLLGRYLVVTSTDSGDPKSWAESLPGWTCRGRAAYSPVLETTDRIKIDGFDESYTFTAPADVGEVMVEGNPWMPPAFDRTIAWVNHYFAVDTPEDSRDAQFWAQLDRLQPESYISDGSECLSFATRNFLLFERVRAALI
jgi:hypothetical protein